MKINWDKQYRRMTYKGVTGNLKSQNSNKKLQNIIEKDWLRNDHRRGRKEKVKEWGEKK